MTRLCIPPTLLTYSPYSSCSKCGATRGSVATKWVRLADKRADVMRRTCGRCGYVWDEQPLDAEKQASA